MFGFQEVEELLGKYKFQNWSLQSFSWDGNAKALCKTPDGGDMQIELSRTICEANKNVLCDVKVKKDGKFILDTFFCADPEGPLPPSLKDSFQQFRRLVSYLDDVRRNQHRSPAAASNSLALRLVVSYRLN